MQVAEPEEIGQTRTRRLNRLASQSFLLAWVMFLTALSLQPARPKAASSWHREFHFAAFAVTAGMLRNRAVGRWADVAALCGAIALGGALELAQMRIYHIRLEWWDIRDDAIGALLGLLCCYALAAWFPGLGAILIRREG